MMVIGGGFPQQDASFDAGNQLTSYVAMQRRTHTVTHTHIDLSAFHFHFLRGFLNGVNRAPNTHILPSQTLLNRLPGATPFERPFPSQFLSSCTLKAHTLRLHPESAHNPLAL